MSAFYPGLEAMPNVHPVVVHFPVVLLLTSPLLDLGGLFFPPGRRIEITLRHAATILFSLGAISAAAAVWTGGRAAASALPPRAAEMLLADHEDWAWRTLWVSAVYAGLRLVLEAAGWMTRSRHVRAAMVIAGLGAGFLVSVTADRGGQLVYAHGLGVRGLPDGPAPPSRSVGRPGRSGPAVGEDSVVWAFQPGDESLVRGHLEAAMGSWDDLMPTSETTTDGLSVLALHKARAGPVVLLFGPAFTAVEIGAEIDNADFDGEIGLVRYVDNERYDALMLRSNQMTLERVQGRKTDVLAVSDLVTPVRFQSIRFVSAGSHQRGYLAAKMLLHGHAPSMPGGRAGLLLDGRGILRLHSVSARALADDD